MASLLEQTHGAVAPILNVLQDPDLFVKAHPSLSFLPSSCLSPSSVSPIPFSLKGSISLGSPPVWPWLGLA